MSNYWETHYNFDKPSTKKSKNLSKSFIDLIIINTIIPLKFAYSLSLGKEIAEDILSIVTQIAPEKNIIIDKFKSFGVTSKNAFQTQAMLQLKNEYCNNKKCLQCAIGLELLKK